MRKTGFNGRETYEDSELIQHLNSVKNYQFNFIRVLNQWTLAYGGKEETNATSLSHNLDSLVHQYLKPQVLYAYNFIAVTERWDESMVLMKLLFDLEFEDVITLSSKSSGGYNRHWGNPGTCFHIPKANISSTVKKYIQTEFRIGNLDILLHAAVNRLLDLTIDAYGREVFHNELEKYRAIQKLVEETCAPKAVYPCTSNGEFTAETPKGCYHEDQGMFSFLYCMLL